MASNPDYIAITSAKYVLRPISAIGIICNLINIMVLMDKRLKESAYTYLIGLACSDFLVSILTFTHSILTDVLSKKEYNHAFWNAYIFYPCTNVGIKSSVWTTMALSIERVVFVSRPLRAKSFCRRSIARSIVISIMFCAIIENIPRIMRMHIQQNDDGFSLNKTTFGKSHGFIIYEWVDSVLTHFIPSALLSCFNLYLIISLRKSSQQQEDLGLSNDRKRRVLHDQNRLTMTLIAIICLFLLFIAPSAFVKENVAKSIFVKLSQNETEFTNSDTYRWMRAISNSLVTANSALNFFVYCLFNSKFFAALRMLHLRICCRRRRANSSPDPDNANVRQRYIFTYRLSNECPSSRKYDSIPRVPRVRRTLSSEKDDEHPCSPTDDAVFEQWGF